MTREELNEEKQKEIFEEDKKETIKKIIKISLKIVFFVAVFAAIFFTYTTYVSTTVIGIREYRITNSKLPENFDGMKIIHFSDLHYGSTMFEENLKTIKKKINERKPDIIIFTGDLIDPNYKMNEGQKELLAERLKELKATFGKYAILGDEDNEEIITIYNQADFIVLRNEYDLIYNDNKEPIMIVGLDSLLSGNQNLENAYQYFKQETYNSNIYTITIVHEPDTVENIIDNYQTDLILAGHSHNGNIRIPIINLPIERKEGAKKYNNEYYALKDNTLYISSGLGTNNKTGIRLFCRPSINFYRFSTK